MKWIKTVLLLPLVVAIGVGVLAIVAVLYLGALLVGMAWRVRDAARARRRPTRVAGRDQQCTKGGDEWELRP